MCLNPDEITADVAFLGVPYGSPGVIEGNAALGPRAVRDTLIYYNAGPPGDSTAMGYYDYDTDTEHLKGVTMVDCGDVPLDRSDVKTTFASIEAAVRRILDRGAFPVVIGGSHAISASSCKAFDRYQPLDVVHIDAHHDYYYGPNYGWTGALRRIDIECGESVRNLTTIGIRPRAFPQTGRDMYDDMKKRGVSIITANRFRELGVKEAISLVREEDRYIYVTLDIDVLDAPYYYGAVPAVAGGLTYLEVSQLLVELSKKGTIVGMDVVDCSPDNVTPSVAGALILDVLSLVFPSKNRSPS